MYFNADGEEQWNGYVELRVSSIADRENGESTNCFHCSVMTY